MFRGKKYQESAKKIDKNTLYDTGDAMKLVVETAKKVLYTGHIGDGKIFVSDVENVIKVRTGEEGYDALQDAE